MSTALTYESTSKVLQTVKGDLHYHEAGEGPPLVLLHGSGPGVSGWANFSGNLPTFAKSHRALVLDLPGFGASPPGEGHPMMGGPDAVIRFLDTLGIDRASFVGNSMGGGIAARVAAAHPDRVDRLVTIGGVGISIFSAFPAEGIILLSEFVEDPTRERLYTWMRSMVYDEAILTDELIEERWQQATNPAAQESIKQMYSTANTNAMRTMSMKDYAINALGYLAQIEAPTLITWGRDDRVSPVDMALVPMRLIRKCELHVFPDCSHWVMIERREEFESVVSSFLARG